MKMNINIVALTLYLYLLRLYPTITRMKTSYDNALFNKYSAIKTIKLLEEISLLKIAKPKDLTLNDQIKFKKF